MPAKRYNRVSAEDTYCHVFNEGVESRVIFNDSQDYTTFIGYLEEYLTEPADPESKKTDFTVKGRTYRGTPHQPKNYCGQVELVAYSLAPQHFHLLLHQLKKDAQAMFLRSLCTRYSIYYNKKYNHRGRVFNGPYESSYIKDVSELPEQVRSMYMHDSEDGDLANKPSSYPEYIGERKTPWIRAKVVTDQVTDFKNYAKDYQPEDRVNNFSNDIMSSGPVLEVPVTEQNTPEKQLAREEKQKPRHVPEFIGASVAVFAILASISIVNINAAVSENPTADNISEEAAAPVSTPALSPLPSPEAISTSQVAAAEDTNTQYKETVTVAAPDGSKSIEIYLDPDTSSKVVSEAKDGDVFELVSETDGWYKILLDDGAAYVQSKYIKLSKGGNT